jgi:hypothetical protein
MRFFLRVFINGYLWKEGNSLTFTDYNKFLLVWAAETLYHMCNENTKEVTAVHKKVGKDSVYSLFVKTK